MVDYASQVVIMMLVVVVSGECLSLCVSLWTGMTFSDNFKLSFQATSWDEKTGQEVAIWRMCGFSGLTGSGLTVL